MDRLHTADAGFARFRDYLTELLQTPARIRLIASAVGADIGHRSEPGDWSIADVARHVVAADAICAPRALQIAVRDGVHLPDLDERALGSLMTRADVPLDGRLDVFETARRDWVRTLDHLTAAELRHTGRHDKLGEVTPVDVCRALVEHEREHVVQMANLGTALGYPIDGKYLAPDAVTGHRPPTETVTTKGGTT